MALYRSPKGLTYKELHDEIAPKADRNRFYRVIDDLYNDEMIDYYIGRFVI